MSGEIVEYSTVVGLGTTQPQTISGLTTTNQYFILKNDEKSFRVCDAGIGGTNTTNYDQNNFVKFSSVGTGFQQFKYPDIKANIEFTTVGIATLTQIQSINCKHQLLKDLLKKFMFMNQELNMVQIFLILKRNLLSQLKMVEMLKYLPL